MAITEAFNGSEAVSGTEWSLTTDTGGPDLETSDGVFQPFIDVSAVARDDKYRLRCYEKVTSGGSQRLCGVWDIFNAQTNPIVTVPPMMLMHGWDFTLQKIAGTDRTITWGIRKLSSTVTEAFSGTNTMTTSEYYLASASTTKSDQTAIGQYQVFLDLNALAKSDVFEFKAYNLARDADSTARVLDRNLLAGDRQLDLWVSPAYTFFQEGWEFSMDKYAGTDRSVIYSIRKAA